MLMLLVRFSFCECGSVVCRSPRPAQRSVFASIGSAAAASAANASAAAVADGSAVSKLVHRQFLLEIVFFGWAARKTRHAPGRGDHSAQRRAAGGTGVECAPFVAAAVRTP
jgi:hypothetical protein